MGPRHRPIQHRYVDPRTVGDPVGKFLWDITERFNTVNPIPPRHWLDWEGGLYKFTQFIRSHDDAPMLSCDSVQSGITLVPQLCDDLN